MPFIVFRVMISEYSRIASICSEILATPYFLVMSSNLLAPIFIEAICADKSPRRSSGVLEFLQIRSNISVLIDSLLLNFIGGIINPS